MSLLTPLYLLGLAAISLPILFHLIRRTPRGRQIFSSLMFLAPSPPRLTRRSRIEHWLLLLLRAAALSLLALAFARPFLRQAANLSLDGIRGRKVAILLDSSASMQRGNLWQQALQKLEDQLAAIEPADDVALFTFDGQVRPVVDFDREINTNRAQKPELIRKRLPELKPSWSHTDLGKALVSLADILSVQGDEQQMPAVLQIVVIGDLQQGAQLGSLQAYEWPAEVLVSIEAVHPTDPSNATLRLLASEEESESDDLRVRISNAKDSTSDQFHLGWESDSARDGDVAIYVPAGQSRVVVVPPSDDNASDRLILKGDADPFDNTYYVVPHQQDEVDLAYYGRDEEDDPDGLLYYLRLAFVETRNRNVNIHAAAADEPLFAGLPTKPRLVVVTAELPPDLARGLKDYARDGGMILVVPNAPGAAMMLADMMEELEYVPSERGTREDGYLLLADIDFAHPLFTTFANPRYSDFTKIHFWNHQRFAIQEDESLRVLARFDNGDPALWEHKIGGGSLFVLASGWHPDDSQLALSSKFVPLLNTLVEQAAGSPIEMPSFNVGEHVPLPIVKADYAIASPGGVEHEVTVGNAWFRDTSEPGIYNSRGGETEFRFAVNTAPSESETAMMDVEQLEQFGVRLGEHRTQSEESAAQRQLRDIELESQQQLWRWLIVAVLGVLAVETWLAGRRSRTTRRAEGDDG